MIIIIITIIALSNKYYDYGDDNNMFHKENLEIKKENI